MFSRLVNIAVGVIMILGGISQFFPFGVGSLVVGIYVIIFGLSMNHSLPLKQQGMLIASIVVGGLEFLPQIPDYVYRYASFLFSFLGRGGCKSTSHPASANALFRGHVH
jgi:hypothetical protein